MAQVGRDLKDHEAPTPLPQSGPPTSISNIRPGCLWPIQPGLEPLQEWGIHNLSGQPVPAPTYFSQTMVIECTKRGFEGNY